MTRVLVVDDSQETCDLLELLLEDGKGGSALEVVKATRPEDAIEHLQAGGFDLMLSDINLEASKDGLDLLRVAKPLGVETILLTGFGTLEKALEAVREGAFDFISKPWNNEELKSLVKRAILTKESREGRRQTDATPSLSQSVMIGSSPKMMEVYRTIASLQNSRTTVLIIGESGTGKELVAQNIHMSSDRKDHQAYSIRGDARKELEGYSWPGNVREMANIIEHLTQLSRGREITPDDFPEKIREEIRTRGAKLPHAPTPLLELVDGWDHLPTLEELERRYIQVLLKHEHRKSRVAEILGKDRTTLYRKLKELGLVDASEEPGL